MTVDGTVEAILDEPVEVEGVLGVDVLSLPESSTDFDSFVSAGFVGSVWGSNPVRVGNTAFEGVLESLQVQFQVNGILLRDSRDPAFFATDVSCSLIIER